MRTFFSRQVSAACPSDRATARVCVCVCVNKNLIRKRCAFTTDDPGRRAASITLAGAGSVGRGEKKRSSGGYEFTACGVLLVGPVHV